MILSDVRWVEFDFFLRWGWGDLLVGLLFGSSLGRVGFGFENIGIFFKCRLCGFFWGDDGGPSEDDGSLGFIRSMH